MSKFFSIEPSGQRLEVVLQSFIEDVEVYYGRERSFQKQLQTQIPVHSDSNIMHCCSSKPIQSEPLIISPLEMVWCNIVLYLQESGYSPHEIDKVKGLLAVIDEQYNTSLALLEYCLHYCLQKRLPLCLMITKAGNGKIIGCEKMETFYNCDEEDYYTIIRLHKILAKALPDFSLNNANTYSVMVSDSERELLNTIHSSAYLTDVNIKTKKGDIHSAEYFEHLPIDDKKYVQILNEKSFQTLTIKRENGKDTFIERMYKTIFTPKLSFK